MQGPAAWLRRGLLQPSPAAGSLKSGERVRLGTAAAGSPDLASRSFPVAGKLAEFASIFACSGAISVIPARGRRLRIKIYLLPFGGGVILKTPVLLGECAALLALKLQCKRDGRIFCTAVRRTSCLGVENKGMPGRPEPVALYGVKAGDWYRSELNWKVAGSAWAVD